MNFKIIYTGDSIKVGTIGTFECPLEETNFALPLGAFLWA